VTVLLAVLEGSVAVLGAVLVGFGVGSRGQGEARGERQDGHRTFNVVGN